MRSEAVQWTLEELLPHRPPMVLIDEVESFDAEARRLTAKVKISAEQVFFFRGERGVPNWVAIEYMAQASAALVGCWDRHQGVPVQPGLLLGTRKLELRLERFAEGEVYHVTAAEAFNGGDAAAFECSITDDKGVEVATANLNAYRPPDMEQFMKERGWK